MNTTLSNHPHKSVSETYEEVRQLIRRDFERIDSLIYEHLNSSTALATEIGTYIFKAGGKRLRPMVSLLFARALGNESDGPIKLAVLLEFLHTATLLHDDVVDESTLRRGRPTINAIWGNSPSVISGDFLYSRAFQLMVDLGRIDIMSTLSNATNLIAEGELKQFENVGNADLEESNYMEIIRNKSAVLFEASAQTGAQMANSNPSIVEHARLFGLHFGLAYQLMDDLLDYAGDTDELGKNVGDDLAEGKMTLPLIFAMKATDQVDSDYLRQAIQSRCSNEIERVIQIVQCSGALGFVRTNALAQTNLAKKALYRIPPSQFREGLESLADAALLRFA